MTPNKPSKPNKPASKLPWSVPVTLADIPESGKHFDLVADEATRSAVAQVAGLRSLPRLQANFSVARQGQDGLRVNGMVSATVGQNCIVTLDPIDNEVNEEVDLVFTPPRTPSAGEVEDEVAEVINLDSSEPLIGDAIDLGALATEYLILGIDPYPRKPGATFEPPAVEDDSAHPFAALAALKKSQDTKE